MPIKPPARPPAPQIDVTLTASGKSGKAKEAHHQRDQTAEVGGGGV